jgi:ribonuclease J
MTRLYFYGGVNEIGGNKILIEDKGTKVFFDFGQSFSFGAEYFTGWLSPRAINGLGDHFEFGLLPRIPGLYSEQQLASTNLPYQEPDIDAIFLSHAHFDHVAHICFVDPKIPIYLGAGTKLFMESMEDTSSFCDYREHDYHTFRTGKKIKIDNIIVEPIHTDHSIPAAYGFIIHTSDSTVAYTGDFRLHGTRKDLSEDFIQKARESSPDALICEGTRMALKEKRQNYSEQQVEDKSNEIVASSNGKIVFSTHYSRDIDRFRSFYNVAVKNGRKLVISPKIAYLLGKLIQDEHLDIPDPSKDKHILVYYKRKKSGNYDDSDYFKWERQFMDKMVNAEYIHKNQNKLIMDLDFFQFGELIDIGPQRGSPFIHSMSEPFSEEDIENEVLHNWLDHFGMQFHQLHASGHLSKDQIGQVVTEIAAEKVFPIHTENAALFKKITKKVHLPKLGKSNQV